MFIHKSANVFTGLCVAVCLSMVSCKKMVSVPLPINSVTAEEIFRTDAMAMASMANVFSQMVNGPITFNNGYGTLLTGMSADELFYYGAGDAAIVAFAANQLLYNNSYTGTVWTSAYKTIYNANSVIEGIAASESSSLTDSVRVRLTAEAKFVRAYCYFYLVNLFGDVPLAMTVDFNKIRNMRRTPVNQVYDQIITDLKDALSVLTDDYATTSATKERIFPGKWAAMAMLARVYLYRGEYANAAEQASAIINNTALFGLESDLNNVFLAKSKEAIWQLKQGTSDPVIKNCTTEGYTIIPSPVATGIARYCITPSLLNTFETGDKRRTAWVASTTGNTAGSNYYPNKYKLGNSNGVSGAASSEYYMMLRLAEIYLIRAEAAANGAAGGISAAIADLNVIRNRAGVTALPTTLTQEQVIAAVARERQVELFAEWGHRWFDLKRTNKAHDVLSAMVSKQPWAGDHQLLYPIPPVEIQVDPALEQNSGY
jgi:starch-binding outer membrane protein, SusD/RagB family